MDKRWRRGDVLVDVTFEKHKGRSQKEMALERLINQLCDNVNKKSLEETRLALWALSDVFCEDVAKKILKYLEKSPQRYAPPGDPRRKDLDQRFCGYCYKEITREEWKNRHTPDYADLLLVRYPHYHEDELVFQPLNYDRDGFSEDVSLVVECHRISPVCSSNCAAKYEKILVRDYNQTRKIPESCPMTWYDDISGFCRFWPGGSYRDGPIALVNYNKENLQRLVDKWKETGNLEKGIKYFKSVSEMCKCAVPYLELQEIGWSENEDLYHTEETIYMTIDNYD